MTALDHSDDAAVLAFSEEVDATLGEDGSGLEPWALRLLIAWVASGTLITLAVLAEGAISTILYVAAGAIVAYWVAGFYAARGERARWYRR